MGTCPVHTVSSAGDLLGLGSSSVLRRAFMKGGHDDVVHVESTFQNTRPMGSALCPQDWTGTSTVYRTGPLCVCTPRPYTLTATRFVEGSKAGCSSCGGSAAPAVGFWLTDA